MPKLLDERLRRDDGPLDPPLVISTGITVHRSAVWSWVTIPTRATDELNTATQFRLTTDVASAMRRLIPPDTEFQIKVQWGRWSGQEYRDTEIARLGGPDQVTPGQLAYIELGAARIEANAFPRRQVLIGIRMITGSSGQLPQAMRGRATRVAGGDAAEIEEAQGRLAAVAQAAWSWHESMGNSALRARAATVKELAWALRRDLRRTVTDLPDGPLASRGQLARLVGGCYAVPQQDHVEVRTDNPLPDGRPGAMSYLRMVTVAQTGFPSSDMELPGGEWLKDLSTRSEFDTGPVVPVEVSLRGRNLASHEALKRLRDAQALSKEQEREAAVGVAGYPPEDVSEAREVLGVRQKEVRQNLVGEVLDYPVWIVEAATLSELDRRTRTLIDAYGGRGITLWTPEWVQDVLYKETVLGDRIRFKDCEQMRPMTTLTGSWFHGGSVVGGEVGPYLGGVIGSTPRPFRNRLTDAQLENEPVTSVYVGRTRAGKSTGVNLSVLCEVVYGAWAMLTDYKGDLSGIVEAAEMFGVQVTTASTSTAASGSMDPFRYVADPAEAASMVTDNLLLMLRPTAATGPAEHFVRQAADRIAELPPEQRSTHATIEALRESMHTEAAAIGEELTTLAGDPLARPVAGRPDPTARPLPTGPGLVYMRLDTLRMPAPEAPPASWRPGERISVMLLLASFAYATYTANRVKGIPKLVALTELHLITGHAFGRQHISAIARMGAALDVNLLLDTQAVAELASISGLVDQVSAVYAFRVDSDDEADAQARLLGLEPEDLVRSRQKSWRPGQCEARDRWGQIGPLQFDLLSEELAAALSTKPERARTGSAA